MISYRSQVPSVLVAMPSPGFEVVDVIAGPVKKRLSFPNHIECENWVSIIQDHQVEGQGSQRRVKIGPELTKDLESRGPEKDCQVNIGARVHISASHGSKQVEQPYGQMPCRDGLDLGSNLACIHTGILSSRSGKT